MLGEERELLSLFKKCALLLLKVTVEEPKEINHA
jgi:hypothetical protein